MDAVGGQDADVLTVGDGASERAARYDAWFATPLGRAMDAAEARAVLDLAAPQPGERALDAGCGTGNYTRRLAERGATVIGVDADPEMLRYLSARGIFPGDELVVIEKQPFDGPLFVEFAGNVHVIGGALARAMRVEVHA